MSAFQSPFCHNCPTCQKAKWLLSPGPGSVTYQCGCYPHTPSSSKSLYSFLSHSLFHDPLHCSRPQRCLLYYSFISRLSDLFAFTWIDPNNHHSQQLTRTVLPQGFHDSPRFFGHALASDLTSPDLTPSTVFQYVDDLLRSPSLILSTTYYTTPRFSS